MKLNEIRTSNCNKSVHAMCLTRWTLKGDTLASFSNNHDELMELCAWSTAALKDTEMKARVQGVQAQMKTFKTFFCSLLGEKIFKQTYNLSRTLQDPNLSAAQGYDIAQTVIKGLTKCRTDENFTTFFSFVRKRVEHIDVDEPDLPRRKIRKRVEHIDVDEPDLPRRKIRKRVEHIDVDEPDLPRRKIRKRVEHIDVDEPDLPRRKIRKRVEHIDVDEPDLP